MDLDQYAKIEFILIKNTPDKFLSLVLSILTFNVLCFTFLPKVPGIPFPPEPGTLGFALFINIASFIIYIGFKPNLQRAHIGLLLLSSFVASISILRGSMIDRFLLSSLSMFIFFGSLVSILTKKIPETVSDFFTYPILLLIRWLIEFTKTQKAAKLSLKSFPNLISLWKAVRGNTWAGILRGVLITLPVALIIVFLLGTADPVFLSRVKSVITINWGELPYWVIGRFIFSYIFLLIAISVLYLAPEKLELKTQESKNFTLEVTILTFTIAMILFWFLVIQFQYLFARVPETQLIRFGIRTYSEYVRRGFSELLIVAAIVYLVSTYALKSLRTARSLFLKLSASFLLTELIIFIFSIFRRVYLYQLEHGFTRVRLYGSGFLVVLGILSGILVLKLFVKNAKWLWIEASVVVLGIIILTTINVDQLVSKYFYPTVNGEVDYVYISRLSSDSVDGWIEAYNYANDTSGKLLVLSRNLTDEEKRELMYSYWASFYAQRNYQSLRNQYELQWNYFDLRKLNVADYLAYQKLKKNIEPGRLLDQATVLENKFMSIDPNLRFRSFDRDIESPLVW